MLLRLLNNRPIRRRLQVAFFGALVCMGGCATVPPATDVEARAEFDRLNDPMEPLNRTIHQVNQSVDTALIEPIAQVYAFIIPKPMRELITNILRNLREPLTLVNDILQGEGKRAGETLGRFATNSTLGMAGLFDVARGMGLRRHTEDFGQTMAVWGIGEGPYIVIPFLGPSTLRDGVGQIADLYIDPLTFAIDEANVRGLRIIHLGMGALDARSRNLDTLRELEASSIDFYATLRSAFRQNRRKEVRNGAPLPPEYFDIFDDFDAFDDEEE